MEDGILDGQPERPEMSYFSAWGAFRFRDVLEMFETESIGECQSTVPSATREIKSEQGVFESDFWGVVMAARKHKRTGKSSRTNERYETWLQALRFAFAGRYRLFTVTGIGKVPDEQADDGRYFTEVVIQIYVPNPKHPKTGQRLFSGVELKSFFDGRSVQECFLSWMGKQISALIPANSPEKHYKKKFENLRVGRLSKLPPADFLRLEYEKFMAELRLVQMRPRKYKRNNDLDKRDLLKFGYENNFAWVPFVEDGRISTEQIYEETVQSLAKQMLSIQYHTKEDAVHSRLFRDGK